MPISQFNGLPRGGKTYHAMATKAFEAARTGHRILTNIEGINAGALSALVGGRHVEVVQVRDDLWNDPTIYPETIDGEVDPATHPDVQIRGGDYLIIDEVHGIWKSSNRVADELNPRIAKFFRYHGKYTGGPLNHSIEICLITHSPDDLPASIRRVVDATYLLISMRNYGFSGRYRGLKYARDGHQETAKLGRIGGVRGLPIEPRIYNTYRSFSHQDGGEVGAAAASGQFKLALGMVGGGFLLAVGLAWSALSSTGSSEAVSVVADAPAEPAYTLAQAVPVAAAVPSIPDAAVMPAPTVYPDAPVYGSPLSADPYGPPVAAVVPAQAPVAIPPVPAVDVVERPRERVYPRSAFVEPDIAKIVAAEIAKSQSDPRSDY